MTPHEQLPFSNSSLMILFSNCRSIYTMDLYKMNFISPVLINLDYALSYDIGCLLYLLLMISLRLFLGLSPYHVLLFFYSIFGIFILVVLVLEEGNDCMLSGVVSLGVG